MHEWPGEESTESETELLEELRDNALNILKEIGNTRTFLVRSEHYRLIVYNVKEENWAIQVGYTMANQEHPDWNEHFSIPKEGTDLFDDDWVDARYVNGQDWIPDALWGTHHVNNCF